MFCKKVLLNILQISQENTCASLFFHNVGGPKKETLTQVFSCEICNIFKKTFFTEHLRWLLLHHGDYRWDAESNVIENKIKLLKIAEKRQEKY